MKINNWVQNLCINHLLHWTYQTCKLPKSSFSPSWERKRWMGWRERETMH